MGAFARFWLPGFPSMKIAFTEPEFERDGALVVTCFEGRALGASARQLDERLHGALARALAGSRATGKLGEMVDVVAPAGLPASRVLLVGLGKPDELTEAKAEGLGGGVAAYLSGQADTQAAIMVDPGTAVAEGALAARLALGARLRTYRFDKYRTTQKKEDKPVLDKLAFMLAGPGAAKKAFAPLEKVAAGVTFARDLVTEPAATIYPESLADRCKALESLGVTVEILGLKDMRKLGMGSLLGVAQGSEREPRLVVMQWKRGKNPDAAPIAFIGKGVTFDSGGLSLKPAKSMEEMKWDMAGSAAVIGGMMALAGREARVNAVGVVGLVENLPSGSAIKPGDVLTSMSGQTIEVLNTDAEGRLVLADAVWYAQDRFKPSAMVDFATLTGAIITALGHEQAGLFANNDELAQRITASGAAVGEPVWRMPMGDAYDKQINSDIADMKNIGDGTAGSIIGAQFIQRFANQVPWAHVDIAGMAWGRKDQPTTPKGATGYGVRLIDQLVRAYYEG